MKKGAALLGLGLDNVRPVPCDSRGRMDVTALENMTQQAKAEVLLAQPLSASVVTTFLNLIV